ncbi:hypothetical protein ACLQ91_02980 [Avibacterium endocarditidis]|uniref:hypothetical protein n=1 Tax=Avibacterium endocarditidis TaxID=380674 RepID=UPI0039FD8F43
MSENRRFVGFGIVGAPKGRQYSSAGADKEINLAKYFDLSQVYGGVLPPPKQDQLSTTLYYLTYREIATGKKVLGIAEYRSAGEMGQSRSGSYLGSFVESINSSFTSSKSIFSALYKMNKYQFHHFIDHQEICYKTMIDGVSFDAPEEELNNIANTLTKLRVRLIPESSKEDLYIYFSDDNEREKVLDEVLKRDLFYIYNNIYFSSSSFVYEKLKENNKKGIKLISSAALFFANDLSVLYQNEVDRLRVNIHKTSGELADLKQNQQRILEEKSLMLEQQYHQQSEQRIKEIEMTKDQEIVEIRNRYIALENELNKAKNELEKQRNRLEESQKMEEFSTDIIKVFSANKEKLSSINMEELPKIRSDREVLHILSNEIQKISQNLTSLSKDKKTLARIDKDLNELSQHYVKIPKEVRKESIFTWIFLATSLAFAIILAINSYPRFNSSTEAATSSETETAESSKRESPKQDSNNTDKKNGIENISSSKNSEK